MASETKMLSIKISALKGGRNNVVVQVQTITHSKLRSIDDAHVDMLLKNNPNAKVEYIKDEWPEDGVVKFLDIPTGKVIGKTVFDKVSKAIKTKYEIRE